MRKLKILHFMPENYVWGGIETYLKQMIPTLKETSKYEISAVVTQGSLLYHALKEAGIQVRGIGFPFRKPSFIRSLWLHPLMRSLDLSIYWQLLPILKEEQPDLVHIHNGRMEQALIRIAGYPMVYTYHGYGGIYNLESSTSVFKYLLCLISMPLFRGLIPFLTGMTVVSEYERKRLYREGFLPKHFQVETLYNGIPTQAMLDTLHGASKMTLRQQLNIPPDARVVSFVCRLRQDRNPLAALRIARRVVKDTRLKKSVYFLVAGEGKLSPAFRQAFQSDSDLTGHGCYLGFRKDVPQLIKASDLTISTGLQEGFGLRVLESMLFGRPCIAYAAGGVPEVMSLPEAQKWLVPVGNEDEFVERLIEAINMSDKQMARLEPILETHARRFDIVQHIDRLEGFYTRTFNKLKKQSSFSDFKTRLVSS